MMVGLERALQEEITKASATLGRPREGGCCSLRNSKEGGCCSLRNTRSGRALHQVINHQPVAAVPCCQLCQVCHAHLSVLCYLATFNATTTLYPAHCCDMIFPPRLSIRSGFTSRSLWGRTARFARRSSFRWCLTPTSCARLSFKPSSRRRASSEACMHVDILFGCSPGVGRFQAYRDWESEQTASVRTLVTMAVGKLLMDNLYGMYCCAVGWQEARQVGRACP